MIPPDAQLAQIQDYIDTLDPEDFAHEPTPDVGAALLTFIAGACDCSPALLNELLTLSSVPGTDLGPIERRINLHVVILQLMTLPPGQIDGYVGSLRAIREQLATDPTPVVVGDDGRIAYVTEHTPFRYPTLPAD